MTSKRLKNSLTIMVQSQGATNIGSVRMSYMNGICCVPFLFEEPLVKNTFFKSFPVKKQTVNLKNPDLDLIRTTHPECRFYGFMIRFWICPKKRKIRFWIRNPDLELISRLLFLMRGSYAGRILLGNRLDSH